MVWASGFSICRTSLRLFLRSYFLVSRCFLAQSHCSNPSGWVCGVVLVNLWHTCHSQLLVIAENSKRLASTVLSLGTGQPSWGCLSSPTGHRTLFPPFLLLFHPSLLYSKVIFILGQFCAHLPLYRAIPTSFPEGEQGYHRYGFLSKGRTMSGIML